MPRSKAKQRTGTRPASSGAGKGAAPTTTEIAELAWAGRHAQAIELATGALARAGSDAALKLDLLDLRAESYIAQGKFDLAFADAAAMVSLAGARKGPPIQKAQSLNRLAEVQMRRGELKAAVGTATLALKFARPGKKRPQVAQSLLRHAEAKARARDAEAALRSAHQAIDLFRAAGNDSGEGRAQWVVAMTCRQLGRDDETRRAAQAALDLCKRAGDQYGVGNAHNMLSQMEVDISANMGHLRNAVQAFEAAGYAERRAAVRINLGIRYGELGLYPHALRMVNESVQLHRAMGARLSLTFSLANLVDIASSLGACEIARLHMHEYGEVVHSVGDPHMVASHIDGLGRLAMAEGDPAKAVRQFRSAATMARRAGRGREVVYLAQLGRAQLAAGDPAAALKATTRATNLHRAQSFAIPDAFPAQEIWWRPGVPNPAAQGIRPLFRAWPVGPSSRQT